MPQTQPKPGDAILDRVMADANPEQREAARENLYAFASALLRIYTRLAEENGEAATRRTDDVPIDYCHEQSL